MNHDIRIQQYTVLGLDERSAEALLGILDSNVAFLKKNMAGATDIQISTSLVTETGLDKSHQTLTKTAAYLSCFGQRYDLALCFSAILANMVLIRPKTEMRKGIDLMIATDSELKIEYMCRVVDWQWAGRLYWAIDSGNEEDQTWIFLPGIHIVRNYDMDHIASNLDYMMQRTLANRGDEDWIPRQTMFYYEHKTALPSKLLPCQVLHVRAPPGVLQATGAAEIVEQVEALPHASDVRICFDTAPHGSYEWVTPCANAWTVNRKIASIRFGNFFEMHTLRGTANGNYRILSVLDKPMPDAVTMDAIRKAASKGDPVQVNILSGIRIQNTTANILGQKFPRLTHKMMTDRNDLSRDTMENWEPLILSAKDNDFIRFLGILRGDLSRFPVPVGE
jgi:hypothetical protein